MGMADAYANGWGAGRDAARAGEFERAGCVDSTGDKLRLCTRYGTRLVGSRDPKQLNLGEQILNASCSANDSLACYRIGQLGFAPPAGATTTTQEAFYYSRRGCELGSGAACAVLGAAYINGTDEVQAEPAVAIAILDRGCTLGDSEACQLARQLLARDGQLRQRAPAIDPSAPAAEQLRLARQAVESGDRLA
jgi:TPR repeat protein